MPGTLGRPCAASSHANPSDVSLSANSHSPGLAVEVAAVVTAPSASLVVERSSGIGLEEPKYSPQPNTMEYAKRYWAQHLYLAVNDAGENWVKLGNIQLPTSSEAFPEDFLGLVYVVRCICHAGWALMKFHTKGHIEQPGHMLGQLQHLINMGKEVSHCSLDALALR
ncbi:hypothetical protein BU17DRAFT_85984 [Hysterangium stoloniferum]|nr:hypothetical protein BU17DRAFT_85984 [Hysterangium stoloniferum]